VSKTKELKKRHGARRESSCQFWKPSPVRAALLSALFKNYRHVQSTWGLMSCSGVMGGSLNCSSVRVANDSRSYSAVTAALSNLGCVAANLLSHRPSTPPPAPPHPCRHAQANEDAGPTGGGARATYMCSVLSTTVRVRDTSASFSCEA